MAHAPIFAAAGAAGKPLQIAARSDKVAKVHFWTFGSERIPTSRVMYLGVTTARGKRDACQADQPPEGKLHGRSLSRSRRYQRRSPGRYGASYRVYLRAALVGGIFHH